MPLPIVDLNPGESLDGALLLVEATTREKRDGSTYLSAKLQDRSGTIDAVAWDVAHLRLDELVAPCVVRVRGQVTAWRDKVQVKLDAMARHEASHEEMLALVPASAFDPARLMADVRAHLDAVLVEEPLRRLVFAILEHPEVAPRLVMTPAASHNHHAYRSGLIEHVLSMLRLSGRIAEHYDAYYPGRLHRGLLAAGVVLHDVGKVWELEGEYTTSYSTEGRLLGHIFMAASFVDRVARELGDIPAALVTEVQHLILSHHGELEYGSPRRPKTLEAMILHYIDLMDARMNEWTAAMDQPGWSPWMRNYGRAVLRPDALRAPWMMAGEAAGPVVSPGQLEGSVATPREVIAQAERPDDPAAPTPTKRKPRQRATSAGDSGSAGSSADAGSGEGGSAKAKNDDDAPEQTLTLFDGLDG